MKHFFYPKLAADSVRKNHRITIPYILTGVLMVVLFSLLAQIALDPELTSITGGATVQATMLFGIVVVGLIAVIFLFYSNTFLMKNRRKELGIYNILGMSKRNISRILLWESLFYYGIALVGGLMLGQVFSRLAYLALKKMLGAAIPLQAVYSIDVLAISALFFAVVYVLLFVRMLFQVRLSNPIEMLRSGSVGEKPPKANWLFAIAGIVLLGIGYWMAQTIEDPIDALSNFFLAVVLVILGTFLLFMAVSVVVCRLLQKNKTYYYKTNHFISVGTMVYRMKRNGAGLAFICILSTMVLVTVSTTSCLYFGQDRGLKELYGREVQVTRTVAIDNGAVLEDGQSLVEAALTENGYTISDPMTFRYVKTYGYIVNRNTFTLDCKTAEAQSPDWQDESRRGQVVFLTADGYEKMTGASVDVVQGQALWDKKDKGYGTLQALDLSDGTLTLDGYGTLQVQEVPKEIDYNLNFGDNTLYLVVSDEETMVQMRLAMGEVDTAALYDAVWCNTEPKTEADDQLIRLQESLTDRLSIEDVPYAYVYSTDFQCIADRDFVAVYSGIFFLGILLTFAFLIAMCMIMYYKQISEGYEDQARFEIQRKVGMTEREIRKSINSQVLTVFFLPLAVAGLHVAMAFHMIQKIMLLFNMVDIHYLAVITGGTVLTFAVVYCIMYEITSRAYYNIVKK